MSNLTRRAFSFVAQSEAVLCKQQRTPGHYCLPKTTNDTLLLSKQHPSAHDSHNVQDWMRARSKSTKPVLRLIIQEVRGTTACARQMDTIRMLNAQYHAHVRDYAEHAAPLLYHYMHCSQLKDQLYGLSSLLGGAGCKQVLLVPGHKPTSRRSATVRGTRRMRRSRSSECFKHAGSSSWAICIAIAAATLSCRQSQATNQLAYMDRPKVFDSHKEAVPSAPSLGLSAGQSKNGHPTESNSTTVLVYALCSQSTVK